MFRHICVFQVNTFLHGEEESNNEGYSHLRTGPSFTKPSGSMMMVWSKLRLGLTALCFQVTARDPHPVTISVVSVVRSAVIAILVLLSAATSTSKLQSTRQ